MVKSGLPEIKVVVGASRVSGVRILCTVGKGKEPITGDRESRYDFKIQELWAIDRVAKIRIKGDKKLGND